ncbi:hypothetical protein QRQ56_25895 [Bradyrhizobium sp. U531]|uniref:hypothetical protein n=1 Tax=Bradyrhizobium sp. U531 TaxID=3053458 RepID=UPI003F41E4A0
MTCSISTGQPCKHCRPPAEIEPLGFQADFTAAEHEMILRGFQPDEMEQKWSVCCDGDWVYFCRSWTKFMIFALRLERTAAGARVADSLVSRDAKQYRSTDLDYDRRLVREFIDGWLLCSD